MHDAIFAKVRELSRTKQGRRYLVERGGLPMFCALYLGHHFTLPIGEVHKIIFAALNSTDQFVSFETFRGCGKTTITTLANVLYLICEQKIFFGVIISNTTTQAELMMNNIKHELEANELLLEDYGDLATEYWGTRSIVTKTHIKFMSRSKGQKVRGLKYRQYRPQIVLIDDPQSTEDVRTKERRDRDYNWFFSEVVPCIEQGGRIFFIGNLLHADSLLSRLKAKGIFKHYSIAITDDKTEDGRPMWLAKFPDKAAIIKEKELNDPRMWAREFMLKIVPDEGQVVAEKDLVFYKEIPKEAVFYYALVGVDLAISKKETADFTVLVRADVYLHDGKLKAYLTKWRSGRFDLRETIQAAKEIATISDGSYAMLFVENVGYQKAAIDEMAREFLPVTPMQTGMQDKRARLHTVAPMIQNGTVLFPEKGFEDLIIQLLYFGTEQHDDAVDALVWTIRGIQQIGLQRNEVVWL